MDLGRLPNIIDENYIFAFFFQDALLKKYKTMEKDMKRKIHLTSSPLGNKRLDSIEVRNIWLFAQDI